MMNNHFHRLEGMQTSVRKCRFLFLWALHVSALIKPHISVPLNLLCTYQLCQDRLKLAPLSSLFATLSTQDQNGLNMSY